MTDIPQRDRRKNLIETFAALFQALSYIDVLGRSYVLMSHRASINPVMLPSINQGQDIHNELAHLALAGVRDDSLDSLDEEAVVEVESTPLIDRVNLRGYYTGGKPSLRDSTPETEWNLAYTELEASPNKHDSQQLPSLLHRIFIKPLSYTPAVFLGTLLNILDGLSYGMIMFPILEAIFSLLAPAGLLMFYMLCIISQLVYSCGGLAFKAGIGSEMIEVTPFFHTMALAIASEMKGSLDDAIVATVIVLYAVLSMFTGLVFWLLGKCRLGALVGFFPRHILVGCIGGVGYFLVVTGIEVSSRLDGGLTYTGDTLRYLFSLPTVILEWTMPMMLAALLVGLEHIIHNNLLVPIFFIVVFIVFHLLVAFVPLWSLEQARAHGWIFPAVEALTPWYQFYLLYKLNLVNWVLVFRQLPTMLALTFFGILHVPINVPALAVTVGMDQFDVDRELVAHGYLNFLLGALGSIQNYLVYTNSVMFIRAGADDRLAGVLLAAATAAVMMVGPVVIGYIPVCVVGALIYLLGYELLKEALYDTWGRLRKVEYITIVIIVVTMGAVDFVAGILVGILLACLLFVVEAARRPVVKLVYTGAVARLTVLRHTKQQEFLVSVGQQICIVKLQGTLFFGSIGGVEDTIRHKFDHDQFEETPIKFLIIDMKGVDSIDFSAAEGFRRILNLTNEHKTQLIFSLVHEDDNTIKAMKDAGLWENIHTEYPIELFSSLNYALEWCENRFLHIYKQLRRKELRQGIQVKEMLAPKRSFRLSLMVGTPRSNQVFDAALRTARDETLIHNRYYHQQGSNETFNKQPLPLLMITFVGLSDQDEKFWLAITKYFVKERIPKGTQFYSTSNHEASFYLMEQGIVRLIIKFEEQDNEIHSSILPNTAFGDIFDTAQFREVTYEAATDVVVWHISQQKLVEMHKNDEAVFRELLLVCNKLTKERFDTLMATIIITG